MTRPNSTNGLSRAQGLYHPAHEHDACGIGFVASVSGQKSHDIIKKGLQVLLNLAHRGACGCDPETGDGAGVLIQIPHQFFAGECEKSGFKLPKAGGYGVGMIFLPVEKHPRLQCEGILERIIQEEGLTLLGWRDTPVYASAIGRVARASQPYIQQVFIGCAAGMDEDAFERKLYVVRKRAENEVRESGVEDAEMFYLPSLSCRTIVYKGLLLAQQITNFYRELADPDVVSALCLVHQRFSTNTFPSWQRAHPYRYVAHNGEINTLRGNVNWMHARQSLLSSPLFGKDIKKLFPIIAPDGSDSANFDNAVELLLQGGRSLPHVMAMLIPEAWAGNPHMNPDKRAFYEYHACVMEPWDGPAAIAFTDGRVIGAVLDRNGLRPSRYVVTKDGFVVMASEVGVLDIAPENVEHKDRLQPGRMFLVDTEEARIVGDEEIKESMAAAKPYRQWLDLNLTHLSDLPAPADVPPAYSPDTLLARQQAFGYSIEDLRILMTPMALNGQEAVGSMGTDTPLAVLSDKPQLLFAYFKQLFAQVTNPPIDPIREELVMSLQTTIGPEQNLFEETPEHAAQLQLKSPILTNEELAQVKALDDASLRAITLPILFSSKLGGPGLEAALDELCERASDAVAQGYTILVLSDRGVSERKVPIPSLLATAAVHHHLIREGTRMRVGIVVESGEPREVQHFCLLLAYGAGAVNPYLAYETLRDMEMEGVIRDVDQETALKNYRKAIDKGVLKVMTKMGISTLHSYRGAQIFEAIGLAREVIDRYFTWTPSRIEGIGLDVIAAEAQARHDYAYQVSPTLD